MPTLNVNEAASKILELYRKREKDQTPISLEKRIIGLVHNAVCQRCVEMAVDDESFDVKRFSAEFSELMRKLEQSKNVEKEYSK